jgi:uncharacterized Ntn-hydrolase superfamily protein
MTYSICALDAATGDLGVAVQTRWFNVGAFVPFVEPGVGAVATQSFTEVGHGWNGIRLMREGVAASDALRSVLAGDGDAAVRQVGMVDASGEAAAHTGLRCVRFASHLVAPGVSVQANMMERASVPAAMLAAFLGTEGALEERLLGAMRAAEREGGDVRGRQSAAIVVAPGAARLASGRAVGDGGGLGPDGRPVPWARRVDLRVEDSRDPLAELARLLALGKAYDVMDGAEDAALRGDLDRAVTAYRAAVELAPRDDQVVLWAAVGLALAGRTDEARAALAAATAVEPRSGEHLRRFAEAGHLPGGETTLRALGLG